MNAFDLFYRQSETHHTASESSPSSLVKIRPLLSVMTVPVAAEVVVVVEEAMAVITVVVEVDSEKVEVVEVEDITDTWDDHNCNMSMLSPRSTDLRVDHTWVAHLNTVCLQHLITSNTSTNNSNTISNTPMEVI